MKLSLKKRKEKFEINTLKQKLLGLIFDRSSQSNLSQINKNAISDLKIQGSRLEKVIIK